MKTKRHLSMIQAAILAIALLAAGCGGGGSDEPEPTPTPPPTPTPAKGSHLTRTYSIDARASETIVKLTGLSAAVTRTTGTASWLTANVLPYTSGTPEVSIAATENSQTAARQQELTFYAANDTLVLTVQQASFDSYGGTSMDQPFSTPTDQPGFSRRR